MKKGYELQYKGQSVSIKYEGLFEYYKQVEREKEKLDNKLHLESSEKWRLQELNSMLKDIEVYFERGLDKSYRRKYTGDGLFACPEDTCREYLDNDWRYCPYCGTESHIEDHMKKFIKGDAK